MSEELPDYALKNRDEWTKANAEYTDARAEENWSNPKIAWGMTGVPEDEVRALPDFVGKDVIELGCGTAYFGAWLKRDGAARVVGMDLTPAQLETARRMDAKFGYGLELIEGNAEAVPLPDASFDLVLSEYGASIWCDPYKWIPEASRLLRAGGHLVFLRNSTLAVLCSTEAGPESETLQRPQRGLHKVVWDDGIDFQLGHGDWISLLLSNGFEIEALHELYAREDAEDHAYYGFDAAWSKKWPYGRNLEGAEVGVSVPPAPPLLLASTSPQRRAILQQLHIPFDVVAPDYVEAGDDPVEHAAGKARSVEGDERPVLGVDTIVVCDGVVLGKPSDAAEAERMLERLSGRTHEVVSGLCLRTRAWEELRREVTRVTFRELTPRDLAMYVGSGEWEGRAGAYAIQGRGAALVTRVEGDYLNVVGLPAAALVGVLSERFAGTYGFG